MLKVLIIGLCFVGVSFSKKLPSFLQACSRSDPNLNKCITEHGNKAWPSLIKGSKEYKLPPLDPLKLSLIDMDAGNIKITFADVVIYNLKNMKITKTDFNLKEKRIFIELIGDEIWLEGDYKVDGKISILPLTGEGRSKFRHYNNKISYSAKFAYDDRGGQQYIKMYDVKIDAATTKGVYHFDNLFNGNKQLTDEMNNFLRENWNEFWTEIKPTFEKAMVTIVQSIIDNLFRVIPMEELFLP